jgi:2,3-bisphosphoglycerate-independent phosphoglycerate mutase
VSKYVVIIPDGAADKSLAELGNKTAIEAANTPNMDKISINGRQGLVQTVPEKMEPGSDVAIMSLFGYDPQKCYCGRAPIEAVAQDIELSDSDWVFRCNFITVADGKMADHSAGHISNKEGRTLVEELNKNFGNEQIHFYPGVSYRNLMIVKGMNFDVRTFPPHDYIGTSVDKILPRGKNAQFLIDLMAKARQLFAEHEINQVRKDLGENPANSIWLWGQGQKSNLESFRKRFGIKGATITAVDLVRGLSKMIGFDLIEVPGVTGYIDTNYQGKASAAIEAIQKYDIVMVHIEAPDETSHQGNAELKKKSIELIDKYVVGPVYKALQTFDSWRILVAPDHYTLISTCAHSSEPVPFAMAGTGVESAEGGLHLPFSEANAAKSALLINKGSDLMKYFLTIK